MNKENDIIYCPFYAAELSIWSEMIEKISSFSMLILKTLKDPKSNIDTIAKGTALNNETVIEVFDELVEDCLIEKKQDGSYANTDLGDMYIRIYDFINNYSINKTLVAVNAFTGLIEDVKNEYYYSKTDINEDERVLTPKISRLLLKNPNYSNIKEYMKNNQFLCEENVGDYDYINFELAPKQLFYVPYEVTNEVLIASGGVDHQIQVVLPIEKVITTYSHEKIEHNKTIIKQLCDIALYDEGLLSDEGKQIVKIKNKIGNNNDKISYWNCYTGSNIQCDFDELDLPKKKVNNIIKLTRRKKVRDIRKKDDIGFIINSHSEPLERTFYISFDDLIQVEEKI